MENFPVSGEPMPAEFIHALGLSSRSAARVNAELGLLEPARGRAHRAGRGARSRRARWDAEFPIDVFQTGSGTSTNMNANEVIARLAPSELGRPRDRTPTTT